MKVTLFPLGSSDPSPFGVTATLQQRHDLKSRKRLRLRVPSLSDDRTWFSWPLGLRCDVSETYSRRVRDVPHTRILHDLRAAFIPFKPCFRLPEVPTGRMEGDVKSSSASTWTKQEKSPSH